MVEDHDEETLSDEDIQAAVRYWLNTKTWQSRIRNNLADLTPGVLRSLHEELPDMLLEMGKHEGFSTEANLFEEAWSALEYSDYAGHGQGETLTKTISALRRTLKDYVDQRMQEVFEPETIASKAGIAENLSAQSPANMSRISSFVKDWQLDLRKGYNGEILGKKSTTANSYQKDVELFIGVMGDMPVGKITHKIAANFRIKLLNLPSNHGKSRTGSLKLELARANSNKTTPRISMKTVKRHFSGLNSLWNWLAFMTHVPPKIDPFRGHAFPGTKSRKSARDAWSHEDLQRLFSSSEYRHAGHQSAMHWLPLISLYSGMRLEEICRLRPQFDLIVRDGIYCFKVQEREGWDPKSEAGARIIPVHSSLLSRGFKNFISEQRMAGALHIFPELELRDEKLSADFSRTFSRVKQSLGVGKKTAFHSFRHTFRTELESTDHKDSHINAIMGHEGETGEGRVYTKGVTTIKLKDVVESFVVPLKFDDLFLPETELSPNETTRTSVRVKKRKLTPPMLDANGKLLRQHSEKR